MKFIYFFLKIISAPSEGCTKQSQRTKLVRPSGLCMLAGVSEGTHMISKKSICLTFWHRYWCTISNFKTKDYIKVSFFKTIRVNYFVSWKYIKECVHLLQKTPTTNETLPRGICKSHKGKKILGNFKWVFIKRGQSSCSRL